MSMSGEIYCIVLTCEEGSSLPCFDIRLILRPLYAQDTDKFAGQWCLRPIIGYIWTSGETWLSTRVMDFSFIQGARWKMRKGYYRVLKQYIWPVSTSSFSVCNEMYGGTRWIRPTLRRIMSIRSYQLFRIALDSLVMADNIMYSYTLLLTRSTIQTFDQLNWPPRPHYTRMIAGKSSNKVYPLCEQANQAVEWIFILNNGPPWCRLVYGYIGQGVSPRCDYQMRCWERSIVWIALSLIHWVDGYQRPRFIVTCYVWKHFAVVGYCTTHQFVSGFERYYSLWGNRSRDRIGLVA